MGGRGETPLDVKAGEGWAGLPSAGGIKGRKSSQPTAPRRQGVSGRQGVRAVELGKGEGEGRRGAVRVNGGTSCIGLFFVLMMTLASLPSGPEPQKGFLSKGI